MPPFTMIIRVATWRILQLRLVVALNKRREMFSKSVHKKRFLAGKFKRRNVHDLSRTQAVNGNQRHQLGTVNACQSSGKYSETIKKPL